MQPDALPPEFSQYIPDVLEPHVVMVARAFLALPFAAILGAALAFRPRARGTPPRSAAVIQTQIVLSVIGGVVMLIVGASLARAFGIVGVASLIRYRTKVDDPKDASVMLGCLTVGLASGVELYGLAAFATLFILGVLWIVESLEPERTKTFELKVTGVDPNIIRRDLEQLLRRNRVQYELRTTGPKELVYEANLPLSVPTDRISNALSKLLPEGAETEVMWEEKKKK
jgi:uncharacterized membrane protein YhiD involved in acid resistance